MKREGSKKLTLYKETLRRYTHELTEQQLAKVLGGSGDGGSVHVCTDTTRTFCQPFCVCREAETTI
jgi:hypothetical protein